MATAETGSKLVNLPDDRDLPEEDGSFVKNFREHPQGILITESMFPVLERLHPDGRFAIGQDCGIYWREDAPVRRAAVAPDWFYVPDVPANHPDGRYRRSYVLWKELIPPRIVLEFASGDGSEEYDRTPWEGKFWVYEQIIRPAYYGIFEVESGALEVFHMVDGKYLPLSPNERGHYPIADLGIELGTWHGFYINEEAPWLRIWDLEGNLLPHFLERADEETRRAATEARRADEESQRADKEKQRAEALAARLRSLGIDPDEVTGSA